MWNANLGLCFWLLTSQLQFIFVKFDKLLKLQDSLYDSGLQTVVLISYLRNQKKTVLHNCISIEHSNKFQKKKETRLNLILVARQFQFQRFLILSFNDKETI